MNTTKQQHIMRKIHYRRKYNCTIADYNFLLVVQNGRCAICGRLDNYHNKHFDIDHDHYTGQARGLLCSACNRLVGKAERLWDLSKENFMRVEKYLSGKIMLGDKFEILYLTS